MPKAFTLCCVAQCHAFTEALAIRHTVGGYLYPFTAERCVSSALYLFSNRIFPTNTTFLIETSTTTMSLTIGGYLRTRSGYPHTFVTTSPDDECMICRDPYRSSNSDEDGCRAIRLECNHIMGYECFHRCVQSRPNICPYYSHHLPFDPNMPLDNASFIERKLVWVCTSHWFKAHEAAILEGFPASRVALMQALHQNQLRLSQAKMLLWDYFLLHAFVNIVLWLMMCIATGSIFLTCWLYISALPFFDQLEMLAWFMRGSWKFLVYASAVGFALDAVLFIGVVSAVLALGLWRSHVQAQG
jgi:hypothetical protein